MEVIDGRYRIENRRLGGGGFSEVYLGTEINTDQVVAIKKINLARKNSQEGLVRRLQSEIEIMQQLNHPNIVKYYDVVKTPHHWYIIMEYCNMGTFQDVIDYHNKIVVKDSQFNREANTWYYIDQLKTAMNYLQNLGYMHRDIKPMNILLTKPTIIDDLSSSAPIFDLEQSEDNSNSIERRKKREKDIGEKSSYHWSEGIVVKLADFGLSKFHQETEIDMSQTICGSPLYMAPELIMQDSYDSKIDLWAFGIVMYQLLHGKHPFHAHNKPQLIKNIQNRNIDFHLNKKFTCHCFDLVNKLLVNDPKKRINWSDLFNHEWFSFWQDNINNDNLNHHTLPTDPNIATNTKPFSYQSSFKRTTKPIKIGSDRFTTNSGSNSGSISISQHSILRPGAFQATSLPSFSSQIGNNNREFNKSSLGPSNLSKMKLDQNIFTNVAPGSYEDYPSSYPPQGQAPNHNQRFDNSSLINFRRIYKRN